MLLQSLVPDAIVSRGHPLITPQFCSNELGCLTDSGKRVPTVAGLLRVRSRFNPWAHGFPFPNSFPPGRPIWTLDLGWRQFGIGDTSRGICGGMVFAAEDYRRGGRTVPRSLDEPRVAHHIGRRLIDSFNIPRCVPLKILDWMRRPDRDVRERTVKWEWPRIQRQLRDHAQPVPLMLIKVRGLKLGQIGSNHQVLAYGYDEDTQTGQVVLDLYDPNHPVRHPDGSEVTLRFNVRAPERSLITHSHEADPIRGLFLNPYSFAMPPGDVGERC